MGFYDLTPPDLGEISIQVGGLQFDRFLDYDYAEDYLSPSDRWHFSLDQDELTDAMKGVLIPRAKVTVSIAGNQQSVGYIDDVEIDTANGTVTTITGRDWLAPAVDAHIDPHLRFKPSMTLLQFVNAVFSPFGMTAAVTDNISNRNGITGSIYGNPVSKKGKPLKSYLIHELKPYQQEGAFAFASRVCQRFGLWIRPAATIGTLLVTAPDFDTATNPPRYGLIHKADGPQSLLNNIKSGKVKWSGADQPSCILASGFSGAGGGEFSYAGLVAGITNPLVSASIAPILAAYPQAGWVSALPPDIDNPHLFVEPCARPLFMYDSEAHDLSQLQAFLRRQMSMCLRKAFTSHYVIMGHQLNGQPLAVDTMISVDDDRSNVHQSLWVLSRHLHKSSAQGTTTALELLLPGALTF